MPTDTTSTRPVTEPTDPRSPTIDALTARGLVVTRNKWVVLTRAGRRIVGRSTP